ncbi:hypothetical protein G9A89_014254 [Geosiphon pyriformis]|nr:hypothetical protein G9A89_014254 [Geosiphon pyriformis]
MKKNLVKDIPKDAIKNFKASLSGQSAVLLPEDGKNFENTLIWWADNSVKRPGVVVQVAGLNDLVDTINFIRTNKLDFAIRCGGHSTSGASSTLGGVLLDLQKLNNVRVDVDSKLIYVQAGALARDVDNAAHAHDLAVVTGTVNYTGIGGLTLGGGFGYLTGRYGLMIDNLVSATIVLADGTVKQLSETENSDLFWAIRGAGSNFGVAYEFVFKAHEQKNKIYVGKMLFEPEKLNAVVDATNQWAATQHEDAAGFFIISRPPPDFKPTLLFLSFNNSDSIELLKERFAPLYALSAFQEDIKAMSFPKVNTMLNEQSPHGGRKAHKSAFISRLTAPTVQKVFDKFVEFTEENPTVRDSVILFQFHNLGKFSQVPPDAMAFGHRHTCNAFIINQKWKHERDDSKVYQWANEMASILQVDSYQSEYLNYNTYRTQDPDDRQGLARRVFGQNLERLKEIKRKYDPEVFFDKWVVVYP